MTSNVLFFYILYVELMKMNLLVHGTEKVVSTNQGTNQGTTQGENIGVISHEQLSYRDSTYA